jgi:hypothetical protein
MEVNFTNLHHAYLLIGSREAAEKAVLSLFEENGIKLIGSPDFFVFKEPVLGIDDARRLSEQAIRHAFTDKKVFLLSPEKLTLEAQNALLKTFEEPIEHTHFFLVLREENLAIPTLRSRVQVIHLDGETEDLKEVRKFLSLPIKDRLTFIKKFVDKEENLSAFLDKLLLILKEEKDMGRLEKVYKVRLMSDDRGALPRLILEHLAVVL